jgi:TolB-like protein/Tfp pilus assembly protein PilF
VQHSIRNQPDIETTALGEHELKNVGRPVRVYAVTGKVELPRVTEELALPGMDDLTVPGFGGAPAIAVLAFDNLSGDPEQEYFADGLADDLITRLSTSRIPVIARNSSFTYKGRAVDVKQVSRELGARYVVEGSVRRAGDRVRVSAQLIDATMGHHLWAETYDRELRDIFAVQDEITDSIVASMGPELWRSEGERAVRRGTRNLDAYDYTMQGVWHFWHFTRDDNAQARVLFQRAAERDPRFALAHAGLAGTHWLDILYQWTESPARSVEELDRAARRGVSLDDRLAGCHLAMSRVYFLTGQRDKAIAALALAVQLDPSNALAHYELGAALALAGRPDDGIAKIETAIRLSPRDPATGFFFQSMSLAHLVAKRYEEAVKWAQRSLQHRPDDHNTHGYLAVSYAHLGRLEEAQTEIGEVLRLQPGFSLGRVEQILAGPDPDFVEHWIDGLRKAGLPEE